MHEIEPFYNWQHLYTTGEDEQSPFFGVEYNEFAYSNTIYNYYIHPHWDSFDSDTLYLKPLYADYELNFCILELIGEWNDAIENDIMQLKRNVLEPMMEQGISKFILITENVLNFYSDISDYYEEWQEELGEMGGWAVAVNMPIQTQYEFKGSHLDRYIPLLEIEPWRTWQPQHFFEVVDNMMLRRLEIIN